MHFTSLTHSADVPSRTPSPAPGSVTSPRFVKMLSHTEERDNVSMETYFMLLIYFEDFDIRSFLTKLPMTLMPAPA